MDQATKTIRFPLVGSLGWLALLTVALIVGTRLLPTLGMAVEHVALAFWATVICAAAGVASFVLVAVLDRLKPGGAAYGFMLAMVLRIVICGSAVFIAQARGVDAAFGYWVAAMYLVMLGLEVAVVGNYVRKINLAAMQAGKDRKQVKEARA